MATKHAKLNRTWTVAEAKARLSEILRLAEEEGPQRIGTPPVIRGCARRYVGRENAAT